MQDWAKHLVIRVFHAHVDIDESGKPSVRILSGRLFYNVAPEKESKTTLTPLLGHGWECDMFICSDGRLYDLVKLQGNDSRFIVMLTAENPSALKDIQAIDSLLPEAYREADDRIVVEQWWRGNFDSEKPPAHVQNLIKKSVEGVMESVGVIKQSGALYVPFKNPCVFVCFSEHVNRKDGSVGFEAAVELGQGVPRNASAALTHSFCYFSIEEFCNRGKEACVNEAFARFAKIKRLPSGSNVVSIEAGFEVGVLSKAKSFDVVRQDHGAYVYDSLAWIAANEPNGLVSLAKEIQRTPSRHQEITAQMSAVVRLYEQACEHNEKLMAHSQRAAHRFQIDAAALLSG